MLYSFLFANKNVQRQKTDSFISRDYLFISAALALKIAVLIVA